jgi:hypothetical protein
MEMTRVLYGRKVDPIRGPFQIWKPFPVPLDAWKDPRKYPILWSITCPAGIHHTGDANVPPGRVGEDVRLCFFSSGVCYDSVSQCPIDDRDECDEGF